MVLLNIEIDDEKLSKTTAFVQKTYTDDPRLFNGGFTADGGQDRVIEEQLGLRYIPFYTIVRADGVIVYNGGYRDDLFEFVERIAGPM